MGRPLDPFDTDLEHLQLPDWLDRQMGLEDPLGKVDAKQLMDAIRAAHSDSALDENGKVDLSHTHTLRPSSKEVCSSPTSRSRGIPEGQNVVRLVSTTGMKLKKCTKCGETKPYTMFDPHSGSADGRQAYCKKCKSRLNTLRRENSPEARLKHHIASRCIKQLADMPGGPPSDLTTRLEEYVGYTMAELVAHLDYDIRQREGISLVESFRRGYHCDHRHPLSRYTPKAPGDEEFRACWSLSNLWMIPGIDNLKKGARVDFDRPE